MQKAEEEGAQVYEVPDQGLLQPGLSGQGLGGRPQQDLLLKPRPTEGQAQAQGLIDLYQTTYQLFIIMKWTI